MKKKILTYVALLVIVAATTVGINIAKQHMRDKKQEDVATSTVATIDYSLYYTYADVEKMVSCLANTTAESESLARLVDPLKKSEPITVKYVEDVVKNVGVQSDVYEDLFAGQSETSYVTKEQFEEVYSNIVAIGRVKGLLRKDVFVMTIQEDATQFYDGNVIYTAEYEIAPELEGKILDIYMKNGKIFKTNGLSENPVLLENVWINDVSDGMCNILYGVEEKSYAIGEDVKIPEPSIPQQETVQDPVMTDTDIETTDETATEEETIDETAAEEETTDETAAEEETTDETAAEEETISEDANANATATDAEPLAYESAGFVADILIGNDGVVEIRRQDDVQTVHVLDVTDNGLQIENMGTIPVMENYRIYNVYEEPECEESASLLLGYRTVNIYKKNGKISTVIINDQMVSENIRVIISNDDYTSYEMETVKLTGSSDFKVSYPDGHSLRFDAGTSVELKCDDFSKGDIITVKPKLHTGRVQLLSVVRECGNPLYDGVIEIVCKGDYFYVINELSLERYLCNVVANTVASDSPEETMKAIAICARANAYAKLKDASFADYDAHLDDSSLCQVYNNVPVTDDSIRAVKDTYGLVPTYKGTLIVPLTFQVSYGMTCTNSEIWGGDDYPYLMAAVENTNNDSLDLSEEEAFVDFINDSEAYNIIDRDSPFYRWSVAFSKKEITEAITNVLEERKDLASDAILVKNDKDKYVKGDFTDIGDVENIEITERSVSGVATTMVITGSEKTIQVTGQTNIRSILSPAKQTIIRQDESTLTGWTSLPSPFYYIEKSGDNYVVHGGGFGHGAGMSIYGAGVLAKQGNNYKYILRHYYAYIDFKSIYDTSVEE